MAKRSATTELNHDNWDAEEEKEEPGIFKPVSKEELQNRVVRKARRNLGNKDSPGLSPFASFSGFSATGTSSPFSFLKKNSFGSEGSKSEVHENITSKEKKENGCSDVIQEKKTAEGSVEAKTNPTNLNASNKVKASRGLEYYRQLQSLNESVLKWMQLHLSKNSCCDFTPVFNDYKKHLDTLNVTYPLKVNDDDVFKKPSSGDELSAIKKESSVQLVAKVESKTSKDETDYGANFRSNTTNTSTISFGMKASPTQTSLSSSSGPTSSSKEGLIAEEKKPFQFSFGLKSAQPSESSSAVKPFSFKSAPVEPNVDAANSEDAEYVPPKNEVNVVKEEDAFYSKRCKLFFKKDDSYVEKGVGNLYLKPLDGKTQLLIRADTNLGNVLLNIMLSASLPMSRTGKNNVLIVCIPNPPVDTKKSDSQEAIPMLIRVKTAEDADELLDTLNKHKS